MEWKKILEKENEKSQNDLEEDYKFINQQLNLIEKNKEEMNELKSNLHNYENLLDEQ